MTAWTLLL